MKYKRHDRIGGFDNMSTIREAVILKVLNLMLKDRLREKHEATQRRVKFLRDLVELAEDGQIAIVCSGRDCDCVEYSGDWTIVAATKEAVLHETNEIFRSADGPIYSICLMKPSEARSIKYQSRDLALEAFEDGHPHVVYSSQ